MYITTSCAVGVDSSRDERKNARAINRPAHVAARLAPREEGFRSIPLKRRAALPRSVVRRPLPLDCAPLTCDDTWRWVGRWCYYKRDD